MANSKFSKMRAEGKALRRITPQQQLWALTNDRQQRVLRQVLRRLKKRDQEDLCYGMVASAAPMSVRSCRRFTRASLSLLRDKKTTTLYNR